MAEERGYLRTTRPQAGAPLPQVSPDSFGAGLGRTLEGVGEQAHRQQLRGYQIERQQTADSEWAGFQHEFVLARDEVSTLAREARQDAAPGHAERMRTALEERRERLLGGITEDSVRRRANAQFEDWGQRFGDGEADFEEVKRAERVVTDYGRSRDLQANRIRRLDVPDDYLTELQLGHGAIEGLSVGEDAKLKLHNEWDQVAGVSFLRGVIDRDPAMAQAMLASEEGLFDHLDPDTVEGLLNAAGVGIRSQQVAAAREAAAEKAAVNEAIQTLIERDGNGEVIADEDFAAAEAAAAAFGDTSLSEKIAGLRTDNAVTRVWGPGNATPVQRLARMAELALIPPDKRSDAQSRELASLQEKSGAWDATFERDPVAALATHGGAPAIDFADPASLRRRAAWARAQTAATGRRIPPLSRAEAAPLAELLADKREGEVLSALDGFADPFDRIDAAQVIDPEDKLFHRLAVMEPPLRATVRAGARAIEANPKLLTPEDDLSEGATRMAKWERQLAVALKAMDPEDVEAVRQSARLILAGSLSRHPGRTIDRLPELDFSTAVQRALGAEKRADGNVGETRIGGLATWGGETPFIVAPGYNATGLRNALVRHRQAADEAGSGPVNPDGTPASFTRAYPVWLGGGRYRWETAGGNALRDKDGQVFVSEVRVR